MLYVSYLCCCPLQPFKWQAEWEANYSVPASLLRGVESLDSREEAIEGQELRYLAPLRLTVWYPQHVQGVLSRADAVRVKALYQDMAVLASGQSTYVPKFTPGHSILL